MLAPFMPCGAKLPVIALFAGVFFGDNPWIGTIMYFVGILLIFLGALLVNKIVGYRVKKSFFMIELPEYKAPSVKRAFLSMCSRGWAYIVKAGTIILVCNALVTIMQGYGWNLQPTDDVNSSILASISSPIAFLLIPLGFGVWQMAAASVTGFIAKENVVGTLASVYGISNFINTEELTMVEGSAANIAGVLGITAAAGLACLVFNLFTPPCFAAIGAMNAELKSKKWLFGGLALQLGTGYTMAFLVYQLGTLFTTGHMGEAFIPGLLAVLVMVLIVIGLIVRTNHKLQEEKRVKQTV